MASMRVLQLALAALLATWSHGALAQATRSQSSVAVVFSSQLGDGPFRTALVRALRQRLSEGGMVLADEAIAHPGERSFAGILRVRSLAERPDVVGAPTLQATVTLSLVEPGSGVAWLARVIRVEYPLAGPAPLESLGEASGRSVAQAICEVACGEKATQQQRRLAPPRRIIKESDW